MKICGIDESGRGPVIGPLVLVAYCIEESKIEELNVLKLKDSKLLSARQREAFYKKLEKLSDDFSIKIVPAKEIDARSDIGLNINQLEALKVAELIDELKPDVVYVDSPTSPDGKRFEVMIRKDLAHQDVRIVSEHKADAKYPVVSAASIIAKVTRDQEIAEIQKDLGAKFGSGYAADPITIKYVKENWENPRVAQYIRKSWGTIKDLEKLKGQKKLIEYD